MATEEQQQLIADVLKTLPMRLRRVFVMAHVQGKARAQIAAELRISAHQVDKRLTRALVVCRRRLEGR